MIKLENVNAYYDKTQVLYNINLELLKHVNYSVLGVNGCGKTSFLRCLTNNIEFNGNISVDGKYLTQFTKKELAKKISMFSQILSTSFDYTVYDTVMMGRFSHSKHNIFSSSTKTDIDIVNDSLNTIGMYHMKDRKLSSLSGGQLQRVFLAKIISQNPDIVLLDEPTNHLDLRYQIELVDFFKEWSSMSGKTIIGVFHDINLAMYFSENTLIFDDGKILIHGKFTEIIEAGVLDDIYKMDIRRFMKESLQRWL